MTSSPTAVHFLSMQYAGAKKQHLPVSGGRSYRLYFLPILFIIVFFVPDRLDAQNIYLCTSYGQIFEFDLNTCKANQICHVENLYDIAIHPNGKLYGIGSGGELYEIDLSTCADTLIFEFGGQEFNSLVCSANGLIYATGKQGELWSYDVVTKKEIFVGKIPFKGAGDLTFNQGVLYLAAVNNRLIQVDLEKPSNSIHIFNFNVLGDVYGIFSAVSDCVNSVTYICAYSSVYEIDVLSNTTTFRCNVPLSNIAGATSQYEFLGARPVVIDSIITIGSPCGATDGKITVLASGGTNQLQFSMDNTLFKNTNTFSNLPAGDFSVYVKDESGCTKQLNITIPEIKSTAIISRNVAICDGTAFQGHTVSGVYADTLRFNTSCDTIILTTLTVRPKITTNQSATICAGRTYQGYSASGTYANVYQSITGCDSTDVLSLLVNPTYRVNQTATISPCGTVEFDGQIITNAGTYFDSLLTVLGCDSVIALNVKIAQSDFLGADTALCTTNEYTLTSAYDNTRWFDFDIAKTKTVNTNGLYWASYFDVDGCEIFDTVAVQFNIKTYVPNVFSPQLDGPNDCFRPFHAAQDQLDRYQFSIFDRWGNLVFSTTNPEDCWNGESNGKACTAGVYLYFIEESTAFCGRLLQKGDVTLMR